MLPWETTFSSFHYNVNVLNSVFGEGKWEEPVTTDELLDMLEELKEIESAKPADTRAYGVVISPELNYWMYAVETWWGQYEGYRQIFITIITANTMTGTPKK